MVKKRERRVIKIILVHEKYPRCTHIRSDPQLLLDYSSQSAAYFFFSPNANVAPRDEFLRIKMMSLRSVIRPSGEPVKYLSKSQPMTKDA